MDQSSPGTPTSGSVQPSLNSAYIVAGDNTSVIEKLQLLSSGSKVAGDNTSVIEKLQLLSCGSKVADAVTVLSPSIEKSLQRRNQAQTDEISQSDVLAPRQIHKPRDTFTMLTLVENQELNISSSGRSGNMSPPQLLNRMSPSMMGRRHSVDSNIGRSRPPTFVRTYREVKWKRVSKPSKLQQLPRTSSAQSMVPATANPGDSEAESREYITGTHIIRQRVPIFMTSNDPPDRMGRRFSAGDLIPVTGAGQNWTPNGKCLVIRDILPSKLAQASSSDDSSSSNSSPSSSSEDIRSSATSGGSRPSSVDHSERYDFSLIDEDEEDGELTEDGSEEDEEEEKHERKNRLSSDLAVYRPAPGVARSSSSDSAVVPSTTDQLPVPTQSFDTSKPHDLRRLVLENSLYQKAGTMLSTGTPAQPLLPAVAQSVNLTTITQPSTLPVTHSNMVHAEIHTSAGVTKEPSALPVIIGSSTAPSTVLPDGTQPMGKPTTLQPTIVPTTVQTTIVPTTVHTTVVPATLQSSAAPNVTQPTTKSTPAQPLAVTTPPIVVDTQSVATAYSEQEKPASQSLELMPNTKPLHTELSEGSKLSDSHSLLASQTVVPRPTSPCEMPWVMTSTKIADANVYVSSSHPPNSHMSVRSAYWISPRSVEGTIPINLEDAKAIRVETVSVPSTPGNDPLQFQKVSYSAGFIISSAQWVAPTEATKESLGSSEKKTLPSIESGLLQTDSSTSPSSPHKTPDAESSVPSTKYRRKYVIEKPGIIHEPVVHSSVSMSSPVRRPKPKFVVVTVQDDHSSSQKINHSTPSVLSANKDHVYARKSKRRFDVGKVLNDSLDLLESDLSTKLMLLSVAQSSSPSESKRRYIVHKVPHDLFSSKLSDNKSLSAALSSQQNTWSLVAKEGKECSLKSPPDFLPSLSLDKSNADHQETTKCSIVYPHRDKSIEVIQSEGFRSETLLANDLPVLSQEHQLVTDKSQDQSVPVVSHVPQTVPDVSHANIPVPDVSVGHLTASEGHLSASENTVVEPPASAVTPALKVRTDTEDDERFVKENDDLVQLILTSLLESPETESNDKTQCGGSTVAIDNKIEQAMDLVKRHLMYAVREEVEILKQQIGEMMDRIGQLEYENTVLRSEAKPETLNKLLQPRLTQPQTALPSQPQSQPASMVVAPTSQQQNAPQVQPSQQQQQQQQTPMSQVGQPPSTT